MTSKYLVLASNGKSFVLDPVNDSVTEYVDNDKDRDFHHLAEGQIKIIPHKLRDEYCLLFGSNILFHSKNYNEVLCKQAECTKNNLHTSIYSPGTNCV